MINEERCDVSLEIAGTSVEVPVVRNNKDRFMVLRGISSRAEMAPETRAVIIGALAQVINTPEQKVTLEEVAESVDRALESVGIHPPNIVLTTIIGVTVTSDGKLECHAETVDNADMRKRYNIKQL